CGRRTPPKTRDGPGRWPPSGGPRRVSLPTACFAWLAPQAGLKACTPSVRALLRRGFGRFLLFAPRAGERVPHAVVALVAGVLEDRAHRLRHRRFGRPRRAPGRGIVDREPVAERVRVGAPDPFGDLHLLA